MRPALRQSSLVAGLLGVIFASAAAALMTAQADNPQIGFWKMNMTKSKFSAGTGFKSATSRIEAVDGGIKHTVDSVYFDSTSRRYSYTTKYDGKDMPVAGNSPYGDSTAISHVDKTRRERFTRTRDRSPSFKYPSSRPTGRRER